MKKLLLLAIIIVSAHAQTENKEYWKLIFSHWLGKPAQSNIKDVSEVEMGSAPVFEDGEQATLLQVNAAVSVNGQKRLMTVIFTAFNNDRYRVERGPFFSEYKSPEQRAKDAEEKRKQQEAEESPFDRYLRTGNLAEYNAVMAKKNEKDEALRKQTEEAQRQQAKEAEKIAEQRERTERIAAAASRLFVVAWKTVSGRVNHTIAFNVSSALNASQIKSSERYNLETGSIFAVHFSQVKPDPAQTAAPVKNPEPAAKALRALGSLVKAQTHTPSTPPASQATEDNHPKPRLQGIGLAGLAELSALLTKFQSWCQTAAENNVRDVMKHLGSVGGGQARPISLGFAVDSAGTPKLTWEQGMISFSQTQTEVEAVSSVLKSALEQAAALQAYSVERATKGEDIQSQEDLFK